MNALDGLVLVPARNSLILIGLTFRTFSVVVSDCRPPFVGFVQKALPVRSPLKGTGPEVTLKVALTLAPGATGSGNVTDVSVVPGTKEVQALSGREMLSFTPTAVDPVVFVNVTVDSCEDPGANVCRPGGVAVAETGVRLNRCTAYLAATMLAWTCWSVASVGYPAVITPS